MKYCFTFCCTLFFLLPTLQAQEEPLYAQYRLNGFMINPGAAGAKGTQEIRLNYRSQWSRFPGAPRTATFSYNGYIDEQSNVGLAVFSDGVGPNRRNGAMLGYAFRMEVGQPGNTGQNYLSLGLGAKMIQYRFYSELVQFENRADPALATAAQGWSNGDVAFGAYWHNDNFFMGVSAPNLIQGSFGANTLIEGNTLIGRLARHYYGLVGYRFDYESFSIEPSVLIKKVGLTPYQIEGNVTFYLMEDKFLLGATYRTDWFSSLMVGVQTHGFLLAYSVDFMPLNTRPATLFGATHEMTLGLDLGKRKNWRRIFIERED